MVNTLLGAWLVVSALVWPHYGPEGFHTLITGLLLVTVAPISVWAPRIRFGNVVLGVWLVVTTLLLAHAVRFTLFHDLVAAVVILALAAVPGVPWQPRDARARA